MKLIVALMVAAVAADRLENTYLPPLGSLTASGNGFLAPPHHNSRLTPSFGASAKADVSSYAAPASGPVPAGLYNAPSARTYSGGTPVAILRFNNDNGGDGTYRFEYETENRISQEESGHLKNAGTNQESNVVQGSYSYTAPDGVTYTVNYIADENGFRASGDHIPTPPPVPAAIQRSLGNNAASGRASYSTTASRQPKPGKQYLTPRGSHPESPGYHY